MDDEPGKLRRNVIVLSAIPVLVWFLGLKLPRKAFEVDLPDNQVRIWIVLALALIYALLRYFHSDETQKPLAEFWQYKSPWVKMKHDSVTSGDQIQFSSNLSAKYMQVDVPRAFLQAHHDHSPYDRFVTLQILGPVNEDMDLRATRKAYSVIYRFLPHGRNPEHGNEVSFPGQVMFVFPPWLYYVWVGEFWLKTIFTTKYAIDLFFPYFFAIVAFIVIAAQLILS